jgi:GntR family transcriptional regulator
MVAPELRFSPVDPESPIPRYYQVESDLRRLIEGGLLLPGVLLPPEHDLCARYGVSRHTIRQALGRLAAENLITRSAGRGTRVQPYIARARFYLDQSFTRQMAEMGRKARSVILYQAEGVIDEASAHAFRDRCGATCLQLHRLRFGDDEPIVIQYTTVLSERCPGLADFDFAQQSLYAILSTRYRLAIRALQHTVGAASADSIQAKRLGVSVGDPLLLVRSTTLLAHDEAIEFTTSYYRADRYEYSTTHTYGS